MARPRGSKRVSPTSFQVKLRRLMYEKSPSLARRAKNKLKARLRSGNFGSTPYKMAEKYAQHFNTPRYPKGNVRVHSQFEVAHRAGQSAAEVAKAFYRSTGFQRRLLALPEKYQKEVADYARKIIKTGAAMRILNRRLLERHEKTPDVYNARTFDLKSSELFHASRGKPFSFVMFDLDYFKRINDTYGHAVGDAVLDLFAGELRRFGKEWKAIPGRLGGEEFGCNTRMSPEEVKNAVDAFRLRIELMTKSPQFIFDRGIQLTHPEKWIPISFTAGIAGTNSLSTNVSYTMLKHDADRALYQGKRTGRARTEIARTE